jgi:hypothetical protein
MRCVAFSDATRRSFQRNASQFSDATRRSFPRDASQFPTQRVAIFRATRRSFQCDVSRLQFFLVKNAVDLYMPKSEKY